jgi:hypothetical protein
MHPYRTRLTVGLTAAILALAGCAADVEPEPRRAASAEETEQSSPRAPKSARTTSPSPASPATTEATPTTETSPTAEAVAVNTTATDRLLTAAQVPGFNEQFTWKEAGTRKNEGANPFGTCHKYAMTSIGAMRVVVREFEPEGPADGATAAHLVAEFADSRTARRAMEVLKSWRSQCNEEISTYDWNEVHGLETVEAAGADAGWYLLIYGPAEGGSPDEGYFDAQGLTRVGKRISVLEMRLVGQDNNYPAGQDPMVEAVRTASAELG